MKLFSKPVNLNGAELIEELAEVGIIVEVIVDFADGNIGFETNDEKKASQIVAAHNGTIVAPEPTIEQKLVSVGLNVNDLKAALGL